MDAITLLKRDHDRLKGLMTQVEGSKDDDVALHERLFTEIRKLLVIHEQIEERVFYPALKTHPKATDLVLEGLEEHDVADRVMRDIAATPIHDAAWMPRFKVLRENVEHHIGDEEKEMFPAAKKVFDERELEDMGAEMGEMKESLQQETPEELHR